MILNNFLDSYLSRLRLCA